MTRADYMQHLREALVDYDSQFVQEILDNYEEHFEAGIRSGRTEEEICEELGNIESFLKDIEDMMGDKDIHTHEIEKVTAIQQEDKRDDNGEIGCIELSMLSIDVSVLPSRDGQLHSYFESGKDKGEYLEEDFSGGCYFAKERPRKKNGKDKSFFRDCVYGRLWKQYRRSGKVDCRSSGTGAYSESKELTGRYYRGKFEGRKNDAGKHEWGYSADTVDFSGDAGQNFQRRCEDS